MSTDLPPIKMGKKMKKLLQKTSNDDSATAQHNTELLNKPVKFEAKKTSNESISNKISSDLDALRSMTATALPQLKTKPTIKKTVVPIRGAAKPSIKLSESKRQQVDTSKYVTLGQQPTEKKNTSKTSALQVDLEKKMQGAQFRVLNEELYTSNSTHAYDLMSAQPELFEIYHQGFRSQVEKWPDNPVDLIIKKIKQHYNVSLNNEQGKKISSNDSINIADIGCGDSKIALSFGKHLDIGNNAWPIPGGQCQIPATCHSKITDLVVARGDNANVYSFDLVASDLYALQVSSSQTQGAQQQNNKKNKIQKKEQHSVITPCDAASLPLPDNSVDCAVFCLSLMGTNFKQFLLEANRIIKSKPSKNGNTVPQLYIAEVRSRFDEQGVKKQIEQKSTKKYGQNVYKQFISFVESLGFKCLKYDTSNTMFVMMEFVKTSHCPSKKKPASQQNTDNNNNTRDFVLAPCIYKRR